MFFCFNRKHYNKAPLVWLSNYLYWSSVGHPMADLMESSNASLDEYPVELYHSLIRDRTNEWDSAATIQRKAKEIETNKESIKESAFVPPKNVVFSRDDLAQLKIEVARFHLRVFKEILQNPDAARQHPRRKGQPNNCTNWILPAIFGDVQVTNKVLPLGFQFPGDEPNPDR